MAPESLFQRLFSEKSDVWSYGITCESLNFFSFFFFSPLTTFHHLGIEILTRDNPYPHLSVTEFSQQIKVEINRAAQYIPTDTPAQFKSLIERCLKLNPNQRPTFDEIAAEFETIHL
jgi:serine/threonine protein kinase